MQLILTLKQTLSYKQELQADNIIIKMHSVRYLCIQLCSPVAAWLLPVDPCAATSITIRVVCVEQGCGILGSLKDS